RGIAVPAGRAPAESVVHDQGLRRRWQGPYATAVESSRLPHLFELASRPGVALGRAGKHDEREHRRKWWAHPIVVGNHLDHEHGASGRKRAPGAAEDADAALAVEMMQEIRDKNEIVACAPVDIEGTPWNRRVTLLKPLAPPFS